MLGFTVKGEKSQGKKLTFKKIPILPPSVPKTECFASMSVSKVGQWPPCHLSPSHSILLWCCSLFCQSVYKPLRAHFFPFSACITYVIPSPPLLPAPSVPWRSILLPISTQEHVSCLASWESVFHLRELKLWVLLYRSVGLGSCWLLQYCPSMHLLSSLSFTPWWKFQTLPAQSWRISNI